MVDYGELMIPRRFSVFLGKWRALPGIRGGMGRITLGSPSPHPQNVVGIVIAPCYGVPARDFAAIQAAPAGDWTRRVSDGWLIIHGGFLSHGEDPSYNGFIDRNG